MASIFWDSQGVVLVEYIDESRTIKSRRTKATVSGDCEDKKRKIDSRCSALER